MKDIDSKYVIKKYEEGCSCAEIAEEFNTYAKKIERILKKNNVKIRSKSNAMKMAIKRGRADHPTEGKIRDEEAKIAISKGVEKAWKEMPEDVKEKFVQGAKERWDNMDPRKKQEMQSKAGSALREACLEGSKAEKFLKQKLQEAGHEVEMHRKGLIEGNFEIDLLLPELNTIIEIDGPQHFQPIFGEERLAETVKMDSIKNGLLIGKGFCIVRIKYLCKSMNKSVERKLWEAVSKQIEKIEKSFPPRTKRFIELEIK
jgi:very-short-patch-repair endonuclease